MMWYGMYLYVHTIIIRHFGVFGLIVVRFENRNFTINPTAETIVSWN